MHSIARTDKILTFVSSTGECRQQKYIQHASSTKTECDCLYGWIKNMVTLKMVNPRDIAGDAEEEEDAEPQR